MKKFISLILVVALTIITYTEVFATRFDTVDYYEFETLKIAKNEGEYEIIHDEKCSGGSAIKIKAVKYDEWLNNDYVRFYVPIYQKGLYNIKIKLKKTPDSGVMQLWFPDINHRVGKTIDLYSKDETYEEINLGNQQCDISLSRWFECRIDGKNPDSSGTNMIVDSISLRFIERMNASANEFPYLDGKPATPIDGEPYVFDQVMEGGTGATTHIKFHPKEKNLAYLATDMGGAYRWNNDNKTWKPLLDCFPRKKMQAYIGVDGMAFDPNNPDILYLAVGTYHDKGDEFLGTVLKSVDRGDSWIETGFEGYFAANGIWRSKTECIAVDPGNSDNVWVATVTDGVYKSKDGFKTWEKVEMPTLFTKDIVPRIITFDPTTKTANGCSRIFLGIAKGGVVVSEDAGKTWKEFKDCPSSDPNKIKVSNDGTVVIGDPKGIFKCKNGVWSDISPYPSMPCTAVDVSLNNSDYIVAEWSYGPIGSYFEYYFYTLDGGENWRFLNPDVELNHFVPKIEWGSMFAYTRDIAIDPFDEKRVFNGGWGNFHMTEDIFAKNPVWTNYTRGIEHGCTLDLYNPPVGARLITMNYDYRGCRFTDVTQYPTEAFPPKESNPPRMDFCENNPNFIVSAGMGAGVYSTDNGINWRYFEAYPEIAVKNHMASVTVSSDINPQTGYPAIVILPGTGRPMVTMDLGKTWIESNAPSIGSFNKWSRKRCLAADKDNPAVIYFSFGKELYMSNDFGVTYELILNIPDNVGHIVTSHGTIKTLFMATKDGLLYLDRNGKSTKEMGGFTEITYVGFGKETKEGVASILVLGTQNGVFGIHRTKDWGKTWECIYNDDTAVKKLPCALVVTGDRQTEDVVYVSTSGRGTFYGIPSGQDDIFYSNKDDDVKVLINTQLSIFDVEPQIINGRTMVPMRRIFEDIGANVLWNEATQTVTATRVVSDHYSIDTTTVELTIGSNRIIVNGIEKEMDTSAQIIDGRTVVPVRFISEALGAKVSWDDARRVVKITI